jgi:hypothetical protein
MPCATSSFVCERLETKNSCRHMMMEPRALPPLMTSPCNVVPLKDAAPAMQPVQESCLVRDFLLLETAAALLTTGSSVGKGAAPMNRHRQPTLRFFWV